VGKKNRGSKGKGAMVLSSGGTALTVPVAGGKGPQLKEGASEVLWEGGASFVTAKWLQGEIDALYRKHNLEMKLVPVDPKKPTNEGEARKDIRALCLKVGAGGFLGRRVFANNGDIVHHGATAAVHQAAGALARH